MVANSSYTKGFKKLYMGFQFFISVETNKDKGIEINHHDTIFAQNSVFAYSLIWL